MEYGHLPPDFLHHYSDGSERPPANRGIAESASKAVTTNSSTGSQPLSATYFRNTIPELEVYQAGVLTVIGFGGRQIVDQLNFALCYDEFMNLIHDFQCETLALDLTGVRLIPSGLLGVLMSIYRQGVSIHLYNASEDIREVLEITKLDRVWSLHEVDL